LEGDLPDSFLAVYSPTRVQIQAALVDAIKFLKTA